MSDNVADVGLTAVFSDPDSLISVMCDLEVHYFNQEGTNEIALRLLKFQQVG